MEVYRGPIDHPKLWPILEQRVQIEVDSLADFWNRFLDPTSGELKLNAIVRVRNAERQDLMLPPAGRPSPLIVSGGGLVLLDQGNLVLRGVSLSSPNEALSVALREGTSVSVQSPAPNILNILAPRADLSCQAPATICGTVAVSGLTADPRFPGGTIHYRQSQNPSDPQSRSYAKAFIDDHDAFWFQ
jgi:hypothetical protein